MMREGMIGAPAERVRTGTVWRKLARLFLLTSCSVLVFYTSLNRQLQEGKHVHPSYVERAIQRCREKDRPAGPPPDFHDRETSDRFQPGTAPVLIRNARIWTGEHNGTEAVSGDILLKDGLIAAIVTLGLDSAAQSKDELVVQRAMEDTDLEVIDAKGRWITPGIVDIHSHLGVYSSPGLAGAADGNSLKGPIVPWVRALDALNTHDDGYAISVAGGVTTSMILPGSLNAIGGQAIVIKLRPTAERSPSSMLLESAIGENGLLSPNQSYVPWRHMKHACGENPQRYYGNTRMDNFWAFRQAYDTARQIKENQDAFCEKADSGHWDNLGEYPDDLQWESLVDVLRGRVKIHVHCYEPVDIDDLVRLSKEFKFPIAAVHHGDETFLVSDVLKRAYGGTPATAHFATLARATRESYRHSEFAPRILADAGIPVIMKSDHGVVNSRYLMFEAQQAHYYGLPENLALASVTSEPAKAMGLDHRIGFVKAGWDADLILWDSHPLTLGATPTQVFVDGIPQLTNPTILGKPTDLLVAPKVPNFDREAVEAVEYEGLPPLTPNATSAPVVVFENIKTLILPFSEADEMQDDYSTSEFPSFGCAIFRHGELEWFGPVRACARRVALERTVEFVNLHGGTISPGLTTFGSELGLSEMRYEDSTRDGPARSTIDDLINPTSGGPRYRLIRAADGLQFGGRDTLYAYRAGVTRAIATPLGANFRKGFGVAFSTGVAHRLENSSIIQDITALHVEINHVRGNGAPSISTQIAALRRLLQGHAPEPELAAAGLQVVQGAIPIVVHTESADQIASLIALKAEVEEETGTHLRMTIAGGTEAHLLAQELAGAGIGVILLRPRPYPSGWESRRIMPGPPISQASALKTLRAHGVTVAIGCNEAWKARNTRFELGWAALEANGSISRTQALALGSVILEFLLGVNSGAPGMRELVATDGGDLLQFESKVVGIISPARRRVDLF
ncbi:unnamed protein product [Peniophora sp. CBMAI 1063]|nr:unnamed protein product [Peniophora sp. CBMAI 1063]